MRRYTMSEYELTMMPAFDFDASYTIAGESAGIAWRAISWETEPDEDTEWSGIENPTGRILAHMIGDDRVESFDVEDLTLYPGPVCSCGQIGCGWHGEEDYDAA